MGVISGDEKLGKQQASVVVSYCLLQRPSAALQDSGTCQEDLPTSQVKRRLTSSTLLKL